MDGFPLETATQEGGTQTPAEEPSEACGRLTEMKDEMGNEPQSTRQPSAESPRAWSTEEK